MYKRVRRDAYFDEWEFISDNGIFQSDSKIRSSERRMLYAPRMTKMSNNLYLSIEIRLKGFTNYF